MGYFSPFFVQLLRPTLLLEDGGPVSLVLIARDIEDMLLHIRRPPISCGCSSASWVGMALSCLLFSMGVNYWVVPSLCLRGQHAQRS